MKEWNTPNKQESKYIYMMLNEAENDITWNIIAYIINLLLNQCNYKKNSEISTFANDVLMLFSPTDKL